MIRVYFDQNVFNILKNRTDLWVQKLNNDLLKRSNDFLYCYSHAHMLDLQRDATDKKYEDLTFMESLVQDNYLIEYWGEKKVNCHKIKPLQAFEDLEPITNIESVLNFDNLFSGMPELKGYGDLMKSLLSLKTINVADIKYDDQPEQLQKIAQKFIQPGEEQVSMLDIMTRFTGIYSDIATDDTTFKELRRLIISYFNPDMDKINYTTPNFNEVLKDSLLKKTFIEYVNSSLNPDGKKTITQQSFFLHAYNVLNLFGFDKEKNKKAKFMNTIHDSMHAYYGACCDYVVSEEDSFLVKTKFLYKLLSIETEVLHVDDFASTVNMIGNLGEQTMSNFLDLLKHDITKGFVLDTPPVQPVNTNTILIRPYHLYFGFFNRIKQVFYQNEGTYLMLYLDRNNYSEFYFFKEIETVVNKVMLVFGADYRFKGNYTDEDEKAIRNNSWDGRYWKLNNLDFTLEINKRTGVLNLTIRPFI